ncbi:MAG: hypothetical protein M3Y59_00320 [Myxococcota bacterium]|nr:hypothetical protein [Myxococcota bacterium]
MDASDDPRDNLARMAEIIDLTLISDARRYFHKLLDARGIAYFLRQDGRPFQIEQSKVEMVVRTAARARPAHLPRPPRPAVEHCRKEIRRELIRRVVEAMLQTGL